MFDVNEMAKQLQASLALQDAKIREKEQQLGSLQAEIDKAYDEMKAAREEALKVKAECAGKVGEYKAEVDKWRGELASVMAQVEAHRAAITREKDAHVELLANLKGQYAAAQKDLQDDIRRLAAQRQAMQADIDSLIAKWSK